jgi:hypothetical protein
VSTIRGLVGVYDADGTLRGEVAYWVGARLGRAHCALCDITHGTFRRRSDWDRCAAGLPVPFATHHRDEVDDLVAPPPYVAAETDDGPVVLVDREDLEGLAASPEALMAAIEAAATAHGLAWG